MVDRQVRLVLPVRLAVNIDCGGRLLMNVAAVHLLDGSRVRFHHLPALAIVQLHPVVLAILDFSGALKCLCKEFAQVVVVGGVFKPKVAYVAKVLVELLCTKSA
jgi:hypothetical protein